MLNFNFVSYTFKNLMNLKPDIFSLSTFKSNRPSFLIA